MARRIGERYFILIESKLAKVRWWCKVEVHRFDKKDNTFSITKIEVQDGHKKFSYVDR